MVVAPNQAPLPVRTDVTVQLGNQTATVENLDPDTGGNVTFSNVPEGQLPLTLTWEGVLEDTTRIMLAMLTETVPISSDTTSVTPTSVIETHFDDDEDCYSNLHELRGNADPLDTLNERRRPGLLGIGNIGIAVATDGQLLSIRGQSVVRIDPTTCLLSIVSDAAMGIGTGPGLVEPAGITVGPNGEIFVVDFDLQAVLRIDPTTGIREVVSDELSISVGLNSMIPIAVAPSSGQIFVVDLSGDAVLRIDPTTGTREVVSESDAAMGIGTNLSFSTGIAVAPSGQIFVIHSEPGLPAVLRIDPTTGTREVVSDIVEMGIGPDLMVPTGIAVVAPSGQIFVVDGGVLNGAVLRIDPTTGNREVVSTGLRSPRGIAVAPSGQLVVVTSSSGAIVQIDPITGNRIRLFPAAIGDGPILDRPLGIAVDADGQIFVVDIDVLIGAVLRIDPTTGTREVVSDAAMGIGPDLAFPRGIAVAPSGQIFVVDSSRAGVLRIDPTTGTREVVSDAAMGIGPDLAFPTGIAVAPSSGQIFVVDLSRDAVLRIDPTTGTREVVSDAAMGIGPDLMSPTGIAVALSGQIFVVDIDLLNGAVLRIDPTTGNREAVSTNLGSESFAGIAVEPSGQIFVVGFDSSSVLRIDPTTGNREVVLDVHRGGSLAVDSSGSLLITLDSSILQFDPMIGTRTIISQ